MKRGGGVAIYLCYTIPFKTLSTSAQDMNVIEYLFLEIVVYGVRPVLGVVYCPPAVDFVSSLTLVLDPLATDYVHHIIMGDFNTDLLKDIQAYRIFLSTIECFTLSLLELNVTTTTLTLKTCGLITLLYLLLTLL